jgi:hypothetical protein
MTQPRIVHFDAVGDPEPGMLYSDRLGPWFDLDGTEIIPVGTEAVEVAVELIIGTFQLRSNLPEIDGTSVAIDFPRLTQLIQDDWDRVMGGENGQLPSRGFLIAYRAAPPLSAALPRTCCVRSSSNGSWPRTGRRVVWSRSRTPSATANWSPRRLASAATTW